MGGEVGCIQSLVLPALKVSTTIPQRLCTGSAYSGMRMLPIAKSDLMQCLDAPAADAISTDPWFQTIASADGSFVQWANNASQVYHIETDGQ